MGAAAAQIGAVDDDCGGAIGRRAQGCDDDIGAAAVEFKCGRCECKGDDPAVSGFGGAAEAVAMVLGIEPCGGWITQIAVGPEPFFAFEFFRFFGEQTKAAVFLANGDGFAGTADQDVGALRRRQTKAERKRGKAEETQARAP